MKKIYIIFLLLNTFLVMNTGHSQNNVLISEKTGYDENFNDNPEAALEIRSTSKGLLIPRMSSSMISYISDPAQGLLVFNSDNNKLYFYSSEDNMWKDISTGSGTISPGTPSPELPGGVALNDSNNQPDVSAMLDIQSDKQGILIPRLSTSDISAIANPANGLLVFNKDSEKFSVYNESTGTWNNLLTGTNTIESFVCGISEITDNRDGKTYGTTQIGDQCWMAENLNIGTRIDGVLDQSQQTPEVIEKYCYNDNEVNCDIYGGMYQWHEAMQYTDVQGVRGICPEGWHLPTNLDWSQLRSYLSANGHYGTEAVALKSTYGWYNNGNGTDDFGFTALPAGRRHTTTEFIELTKNAIFWSSTKVTSVTAHYSMMTYNNNQIVKSYRSRWCGISIRCIKN